MVSGGGTQWAPVLLDGAIGAFLGTLASAGIAIYVVRRQLRADRSLAREERRHAAAIALLGVVDELSRWRYDLLRQFESTHPEGPEGWADRLQEMARREQYGLPLAVAVGGPVFDAWTKFNKHVGWLWITSNEPEFADVPEITAMLFRLAEPIDDLLGALREQLTASTTDA